MAIGSTSFDLLLAAGQEDRFQPSIRCWFLSAHLLWPQLREAALLRSCPMPSAFPEGKGDFHVLHLLNGGM